MDESIKFIIEYWGKKWLLWGLMHFPFFLLAILGGMARIFARRDKYQTGRQYSFLYFLSELLSSIFAGMVTLAILEEFPELGSGYKSALVGLAGYGGNALVETLYDLTVQKVREYIINKGRNVRKYND